MLNELFRGLFDAETTTVIAIGDFLLCVLISLAAGLMLAGSYMYRCRYTRSFVFTLTMLPAVVCVVIMMVNGNVGTGVAVAGAFSLVRFRSVPGTAKEISMLFLAMGAGLIAGMGYLAFALLFTLLMGVLTLVFSRISFGAKRNNSKYKTLTITIPEDLDYSGIFDEIFLRYATAWELTRVKTTNMGSMFRLTYDLTLKDTGKEKAMLDELRCRNGNLEISVSPQSTMVTEL
ncbi:MAG: DUF4956 domain-containing protein [Ruminococcaceae bacterium]|nr:DUF4956 domain-containing protein [Oscillospiraceae bacterium]